MKGFRLLAVGETIEDGDQWQDSVRGWLPALGTVGATVKAWEADTYRRAITIEDQANEYANALIDIQQELGMSICAEPAEIVERVKAVVSYRSELLDALKPFANYACELAEGESCECNNCNARAAIAKATGKEGA